jgi:hypothetical protein
VKFSLLPKTSVHKLHTGLCYKHLRLSNTNFFLLPTIFNFFGNYDACYKKILFQVHSVLSHYMRLMGKTGSTVLRMQ